MFPSILTQQADKFVSQGGFYSESSQRRVTSDAYDWANVNMSLQHAAERMTPAVLTGYDRWKPRDLSCAAISESCDTPAMVGESETSLRPKDTSQHEVQGFLIFGLSEDAMKCCDELFCSSSSLKDAYGESHSNISVQRRFFSRKLVSVSFSLKGGEMSSIDATTYVSTPSATSKRRKWDINKFVRSRGYHRLLLISEEKELAKIMGITFVLPGDALSDAILRRNVKDVSELLRQGYDVNAPCQAYGRALQTASAQGFEDTVNLLLENGAEVNATGGQYESALVAATVHGHEGIARILIKAGGDVLKEAASYISPLYQAVSHSDVDMVLLLLERGAWLSRNYGELLDLASERGNEEVSNLLHEYDVRDLRLKLPASAQGESGTDPEQGSGGDSDSDRMRRRRHSSNRNQVVMKPAKIVRAVVCRALILKGQRGKWTGIKGVNIMRTAIEAGVPPQILDLIAPHLSTIQDILDFLKRAVFDYASQKRSPVTRNRRAITSNHVLGTVTELIDDSEGDENPAEGPNLEQVPSRRVHFASEPRVAILPWEPTPALPHPVASFRDSGLDIVSPSEGYSRRTVCPACEGRGGRRGTGYPCSKCQSTGRYQDTRCSACKGVGQIFSERNSCHNCDGARFMYTRDRAASEPSIFSENQTGEPRPSPSTISHRRSRREQPDPYPFRPFSNVDYTSASLHNGSSRRTISRPRDRMPRPPSSNQSLNDDPPPPYSSQDQVLRNSR
jgi:Ankyrin repeats (3 copies)